MIPAAELAAPQECGGHVTLVSDRGRARVGDLVAVHVPAAPRLRGAFTPIRDAQGLVARFVVIGLATSHVEMTKGGIARESTGGLHVQSVDDGRLFTVSEWAVRRLITADRDAPSVRAITIEPLF